MKFKCVENPKALQEKEKKTIWIAELDLWLFAEERNKRVVQEQQKKFGNQLIINFYYRKEAQKSLKSQNQ